MSINEKLIRAACSPTIYKRGGEYFREGRVHLKKRGDNHISAAVDDERIFTVDVNFDDTKVTKSFCTCPYYQTMRSPCKHIIAALMQYRQELAEGGNFTDANDKIALALCSRFAARDTEDELLRARFTLYIKRGKTVTFAMSAKIEGTDSEIDGIDNFLESFINGREFRFDKNHSYIPGVTRFPKAQEEIFKILAEAYSDRSADLPMYTKAIYQTTFSGAALSRLMPYLKETDTSFMLDGIKIPDILFADDNPDILIDISATDEDITMSIGDRGLALTADGEWFLYENTIYHTDAGWREYFMPIYSAVESENRMQIVFRGGNRMLFVKHILPVLQDRQGVIAQGLDELIIDSAPTFDIYLDAAGNTVSAVIIARYGSIPVTLGDEDNDGGKIILRDMHAESRILSEFDHFNRSGRNYTLHGDDEIFEFATAGVKRLSQLAALHYSKSFSELFDTDYFEFSAAVDYNEKIDLLEAGFKSNLSPAELVNILRAIRLKKRFYRLPNGHFLDFENDERANLIRLLNQLDFSEDDIFAGVKSVNKYFAMYLDAARNITKRHGFNLLIENMRSSTANIPEGLDNVLRDYQKTGIMWLKQLSVMDFGGILADDMGLGKTLQVLAYIHGEGIKTPTLIVTPSALMYNWLNELNRFIPDATALIIDGSKEERAKLIETISDYEFVITSYPLLRRDTALYKNLEFEYFFIDEAQHIKNPRTMNARAVKRIRSRHRFAVTGTPIENSLSELWSVFDFIMPGYLYDLHTFRERYEYPIMRGADSTLALELRSKIKPFIMRRMKSEVLRELPERIENTIYADLTNPQRNMYSAFLEVARNETAQYLMDGGSGKMRILTLLMRLRQICCHPSLFDRGYKRDSGKLNLLMELVESARAGGHRILVFSQFTSMLAIITEELNRRNISSFYLDGRTPPKERADMTERFNSGENDVFLISLKAGGTGLNLTGADMVIHYDPWWNPAVTDQASDRVYRLGQTRAVQIIKLASRGTIEEKILRLQEKKRSLADDIIKTNNAAFSSLTDEEIMALFK